MRKRKQNICTISEMALLLQEKAAAPDPVTTQFFRDLFGEVFAAYWEERRQEVGRGYAAMLCRVLEHDCIPTMAGRRPG